MQSKKNSYLNFVKKLNSIISEYLIENPDALKEALEEEGINKDEIVGEGLDLVRKLSQQQRAAYTRQKNEKLLSIIREIKSSVEKLSRKQIIAKFKNLIPESEQDLSFQAFFRNLEKVNDDDLREMLDEAEILKILKSRNDEFK